MTKLKITPLTPPPDLAPLENEAIEVQFNPNSYSISKPVSWQSPNTLLGSNSQQSNDTNSKFNAPELKFTGGGSRVLNLELFFDVTETEDDVRKQTNKIVQLTRMRRGQSQDEPPPVCRVSWGNDPAGSDFPFDGVITNLAQKFTLFRSDGTPVRAHLTVTFTEYIDPKQDKKKTDPELTTHAVRRGDTLSSIAAQIYGEAKAWRLIAEANHLDDPRHLTPGKTLTIPKRR